MIPLRDENPTRRAPILTIGLIAACVLVFMVQLSRPDDGSLESRQALICEFGLVADHLISGADPEAEPCQLLNQRHEAVLTLVTSQFLHGDWFHLIFNMLFLWVFGNNIEDRLGRLRLLPFYLLCGVLAGGAEALGDPDSAVPLIGASGAIAGILGAYLILYPRVRVWTVVLPFFFLPFRLPAWLWLLIYLGLQVLYLGDSSGGGEVAYLAHIAGFIAGALLIRPFMTGRREGPPPGAPVAGAPA